MKKKFIIFPFILTFYSLIFADQPKKTIFTNYLKYENETIQLDIYNPGIKNSPIVILIYDPKEFKEDFSNVYKNFAKDLMEEGLLAINIHYSKDKNLNWEVVIIHTINYAQTISNTNKENVALVSYYSATAFAIKVASVYKKVKLVAINSGVLPIDFTKEDAKRLPKILIIGNDKEENINTLYKLKNWLTDLNKPFETRINRGVNNKNISLEVFKEDWQAIKIFLTNNFGLTSWQNPTLKIKLE